MAKLVDIYTTPPNLNIKKILLKNVKTFNFISNINKVKIFVSSFVIGGKIYLKKKYC